MAIPYYRWFPGDYARDTRHLSLMQHGVYRLLIDLYMDQGGPLRNDLQYLHRWVHAESVEEKNAVEFILGDFFVLGPDGWSHKRCEQELSWQKQKSRDASESANKRWHTDSNANAMRTHSVGNANQNQNQNQNQIKDKPRHAPRKRGTPFVLPDWLVPHKDVWDAWVEGRTKAKHPPTEWAKSLAVIKLEDLRDQGYNPRLCIAESAFHGWSSFYPPKKES